MALMQRQFEKNSSTSSLSPEDDFCSKSFLNTFENISIDMSICLEKTQQLFNGINTFSKQYKNQQVQIKKLQDLRKNKKKKQAFKKNQELPIIQSTINHFNPYIFSPTIVFR